MAGTLASTVRESSPTWWPPFRRGRRSTRDGVYLFGHSAGAIQSLMLGLLESEYFAAVAVHAGALPNDTLNFIDLAERKIPIALWVGSGDPLFPVRTVEATRDAMEVKGFKVPMRVIQGHTHNYYSRAGEINKEVWAFLNAQKLDADPKYKPYAIR